MTAEEIHNLPNHPLPAGESTVPRIRTNAECGFPEYAVRKKPKPKKRYIKPESLIKFNEQYQRWYYSTRHIQVNHQMKSAFSDDSANNLTKAIVAYITMIGGFAARINSTGTYSVAQKRFIRSGSTKGMADVNAVIRGLSVQFEVKFGKDKIRASQSLVKEATERAGGAYYLTHTFDEFLSQIEKYL